MPLRSAAATRLARALLVTLLVMSVVALPARPSFAAASLTINVSTVAAGNTVTVSWSGIDAPTPRDWVGLYPVGTTDDTANRVSFQYTDGTAVGSMSYLIAATLVPGDYNFRLFANDSLVRLAVSPILTVTAPNVTVTGPSSATADSFVTVSWSGHGQPTATDWIGLYPVGSTNDVANRVAWRYTTGTPSGSISFLIPAATRPADYEFRMFFQDGLTLLGKSAPATITAPNVPLTPSTLVYRPGDTVSVSWRDHAQPTTTDWIGLYPVGATDDTANRLTWRYTTGAAAGTVDLVIPPSASSGQFDFRMFWNDGLLRLGRSAPGGPGDFGASQPHAIGAWPAGAFSPDPVNLATGSFTHHAEDLALLGRVLGLSFTRWYNSADATTGPLGPGWTHSCNWSLKDAGATVELRRGDGRRDTFSRSADGSYANPPDTFDVLVKNADGSFTLTLTNQRAYSFSTAGQLTRIREPAGNQITFSYTAGNLTTITDSVGRQLTLGYDAANHLTQLQDPLGRKVTYAYDASGRLATVTDWIGNAAGQDPTRHQWRYAYDGTSQHLTTISDPDGRVRVTNAYDAQGRVFEQRDGLGSLTTFAYSAGQTVLTDPRGTQTTYTFGASSPRARPLAASPARSPTPTTHSATARASPTATPSAPTSTTTPAATFSRRPTPRPTASHPAPSPSSPTTRRTTSPRSRTPAASPPR